MEQTLEWNTGLYMVFVDFEKAYRSGGYLENLPALHCRDDPIVRTIPLNSK